MGALISQSFPPKSHFQSDDVPDLTGRVIIVTGGNTGIGYHTVKALIIKNAKVYMASRSQEKAQAAIERLKSETGKETLFLQVDLASKQSVRNAVSEFQSKETELHILFNSGGVMTPPIESLTADGYDLQFGTNVVGHYLLTVLLLPQLEAGAMSSPDKKARIINTSSFAHTFATKIDYSTMRNTDARKKMGSSLYPQSKFGTVVLSNEFARRFADKGIISISLNPGNLRTELQRHSPQLAVKLFGWLLYPAPYGALTQLWAGTSPETIDMNGKYLIPWAREGPMQPQARDPKVGEELWNWLEAECKV